MHARDNMSDEIPVADGVEQDQETAPSDKAGFRACTDDYAGISMSQRGS
jgi:hypothetical protein